ncbi:hypothetical protein CPB85DRAFT_1445277 [Mucidula mucida]|nr:hypothetical protein CPB85DRAFT_1445277 [Mucidula mucida]
MADPYPGIHFSPYPLVPLPVPRPPKVELQPALADFGPMNVDFPIEIPIPFNNPRHHTILPPMPISTPTSFGVPLPGYKVGGCVYTLHHHSSRIFSHYQETMACVTKPERDAYMFIYSNKLDEDGFQMVTDVCTPGFKASYYVPVHILTMTTLYKLHLCPPIIMSASDPERSPGSCTFMIPTM